MSQEELDGDHAHFAGQIDTISNLLPIRSPPIIDLTGSTSSDAQESECNKILQSLAIRPVPNQTSQKFIRIYYPQSLSLFSLRLTLTLYLPALLYPKKGNIW